MAGAVDVQQADATRCGGVTGFLQVARALRGAITSTCPAIARPRCTCTLACAAPRFRHLEWFHDHVRIEHMLFDGAPVPRDGVIRPDLSRPGLGLDFKRQDAERCAVQKRMTSARHRRLGAYGAADACGGSASSCETLRQRSFPSADRQRRRCGPRGGLNRAAGMLALSVLADSAIEHYRGSFENTAMFTPLVVSGSDAWRSARMGTADERPDAHRVRDAVYAAAALTGLAGTGFHVYNVLKRPGRLCWQNLFYGAPLGRARWRSCSPACSACTPSGCATTGRHAPRVFGLPAGRALAALTGAGLLGTAGEAGLLHFRGAYHNPFMFAAGHHPAGRRRPDGEAALGQRPGRDRWFTRWWLRLTALLGFAGVGFHALGVSRNMGGWRNWSQNLLNGPPLPAPPSFTGLALAGLAALGLLEDHPDA